MNGLHDCAGISPARLEELYGQCERQGEPWTAAGRYLQRRGIDARTALAIAGRRCGWFFGVARIGARTKNRFEFDETGNWHVILPELERGEIVDLVAFSFRDPRTLRSLRGSVGLLGEEEVFYDTLLDGAVNLYDDPLHWLRHGCQGAVVVSLEPLPAVLEGARIVARSLDLARRLAAAFAVPRPTPRIDVMLDEVAA